MTGLAFCGRKVSPGQVGVSGGPDLRMPV